MLKRTKSKQKKALEMAGVLKRQRSRYLTQGVVAMLVSLAACCTPGLLYLTGIMAKADYHVLIAAVIVVAASGFIGSNRAQKYKLAQQRYKDYCFSHSLNEADVV